MFTIVQEDKTVHTTHLCEEISEMVSRIEILEMQNVKLKEDNKKLTKRFGQKKTESDDDMSLQKV